MANPTAPDLTDVVLPFEPISFWIAGDYDPAALVTALRQQPGLEDFTDGSGNVQSAVRLDADVSGSAGWWVTIPYTVAQSTVQAGVAAYVAPPTAAQIAAEPATAEDHADASAALITEKLAAIPVSRAELPTILQTLLGEAAGAIPYFEEYAHDPSMTSQQWTNFQALPQATKDRLLYDACRSLAALMRYLTGDLPTS